MGVNEVNNANDSLQFSPNPEGEVKTGSQGEYFDWCFLILSTAIKPKLSMNILLYTSKARGKYVLKNISWQKIRPFCKNMHLWQLFDVDSVNKEIGWTKSNYKFWGVTPKCLFSRDVTSGHHNVTRLRSCHDGIVVWSL